MVFLPAMSFTGNSVKETASESPQTSDTIAWTPNGTVVCNFTQGQNELRMISDGAGGAIITWRDWRSASNYDIYAQRIDSNGNNATGWPGNGTAICTDVAQQRYPELVSDGSGGAIIVWQDWRGAQDVYAQRINSTGGVEWTTNGIAVCSAAQSQSKPTLVSDGAGGAIITWNDWRSASTYDIYAQRINSTGDIVAGWTPNGVLITNITNDQDSPKITSDGAGGAIISWQDRRDQGSTEYDVYAQKINSTGVTQWTANGTLICNALNWQDYAKIISDGAGGAIITWHDSRNPDLDIYAQRVNSTGFTQWTANGTLICNATGNQGSSQMITDGLGGAIIVWEDLRGVDRDIYAQKINSAGITQWTTNGTAICTADQDQGNPEIVSDGAGGAIITYENDTGTENDVYAQKINSAGAVQWGTNGIPISTAPNDQTSPDIASDGAGGAIIAWDDERVPGENDIYAQRIADLDDPLLTHNPGDASLAFVYTGYSISWRATDANPENYTIELIGTCIVAGPTAWMSGIDITYNIPDGMAAGIYVYNITIVDANGNSISDSVSLTVSPPASNGDPPADTPPGIPGFDLMILSIISTISVIILLQKNRKKQL